MEYMVSKDKLYVMGKAWEIKEFFNEKIKFHSTLKDLIASEIQLAQGSIKEKHLDSLLS